jgi:hypothetical protein
MPVVQLGKFVIPQELIEILNQDFHFSIFIDITEFELFQILSESVNITNRGILQIMDIQMVT